MFCSVSFAAAQANASEPETAQSDESAVISIVEYTGNYALDVLSDTAHIFEKILYRFDVVFSFLYSVQNNPVTVNGFEWRNAAPVLAKDGSSAYFCTISLSDDVNFLQIFSDITVWYEYSENGIFWTEVKRDNGCTFVRNKLWQGYICSAGDNSIKYNNLGNNLILPAGTRFSLGVDGDASDCVTSLYNLDDGTAYYIRLVMYARTDKNHTLFESPALRCVR